MKKKNILDCANKLFRNNMAYTKPHSPTNDIRITPHYLKNFGKNYNPSITWRIVSKKSAYTPESDRCPLCLQEKYKIANYPGKNFLNKRTELHDSDVPDD